jgi:serine/threonine protein kinase
MISDRALGELDFGYYLPELSGLRLGSTKIETRNSTVFRGFVPSTGVNVAVKRVVSKERARLEYESLLTLYARVGDVALVAKPMCAILDHCLVVTEWVAGRSVHEYLVNLAIPTKDAHAALSASGQWLRRFHGAGSSGCAKVDLVKKLAQVDDIYEASRHRRVGQKVLGWMREQLHVSSERIAETRFQVGCLHGDLKPTNLLVDGDRVTAIDIGPIYRSLVWNDVAYYLIQIQWSIITSGHLKRMIDLDLFCRSFLDAYQEERDEEVEMLLNWLEREVLYRLAFHHLRGPKLGLRNLAALAVIGRMFVSRTRVRRHGPPQIEPQR